MPAYRERLRVEGLTLAGCGLAGAGGLIAFCDEALDGPASTIGQLVVVAVLLAVLGPLTTRRAMADAVPLGPEPERGGSEPTPLWQLPLIVAGLSAVFVATVGWDAGMRVVGGCLLVGLAQAILLERLVAREERRRGVRFFRVPGSSLLTGTKLGALPR